MAYSYILATTAVSKPINAVGCCSRGKKGECRGSLAEEEEVKCVPSSLPRESANLPIFCLSFEPADLLFSKIEHCDTTNV